MIRLKETRLLVGPVFTREVTTIPRSWRFYFSRALYVAALFGLVATARMILSGSQEVRSLGDLARFGSAVFAVLAPLQLAVAVAFAALLTAAAVSQEKDRRTFDLMLMTNLTNAELVLGKLFSSILGVLVLGVAAIPLLMLITLLGGISYVQVARVVGVTLTAALAAGSLGSMLALWREKTFQSLALAALLLVLWLLGGELIAAGLFGPDCWGITAQQWAIGLSPARAIMAAAEPLFRTETVFGWIGDPVNLFMLVACGLAVVLNLWAIARVRVWNPAQETRLDAASTRQPTSDADQAAARPTKSRPVWDNPILWREIRTWAYGKRILLIHVAYLIVFALCAAALFALLQDPASGQGHATLLPPAARPLVPLVLLGLVLVNALAVTSLTSERDLKALDLLLVTDLTPKEIIFGKLGGIWYNAKEMILMPLLLGGLLWWHGLMGTEQLVFFAVTLLVMNAFVAILGIHAGMTYASSRTAVAVSLGTVLFLLLGIAVCMRMMLAFQTSFSYQLQAFLAFILGGGIGLYVALGPRNRSAAIGYASFGAPFATFFVITSFIEGNMGAAFLVAVATYGFATAAMLIPAIDEFDVATGRTSARDL